MGRPSRNMGTQTPTRDDCSYYGAFYEGEGHVMGDKHDHGRLVVTMAQNERTILDYGLYIWGGAIYTQRRKSPASDKICTCHIWRLTHCASLRFFKDIKPFMKSLYKLQQYDKAIHMFETKEGVLTEFPCKKCGKMYKSRQGRRMHMRAVHDGIKYRCEECNKTYNFSSALTRHMRFDHRKSQIGVRYHCDECDLHYKHNESLNIHKKRKHAGNATNADASPGRPGETPYNDSGNPLEPTSTPSPERSGDTAQ